MSIRGFIYNYFLGLADFSNVLEVLITQSPHNDTHPVISVGFLPLAMSY